MKSKENILVSACLLGDDCKYSGGNNYIGKEKENKLKEIYNIIKICPECMGGLPTPRHPSERVGNKVVNNLGQDVTRQYNKGAEYSLKLAKENNVKLAVLKKNSPSCGHGTIYDGTFSGTLKEGSGVTGELLSKNGIVIINENDI